MLSEDVNLAANYMYSKCLDDASDYFEQPDNPSNLGAERAPALSISGIAL